MGKGLKKLHSGSGQEIGGGCYILLMPTACLPPWSTLFRLGLLRTPGPGGFSGGKSTPFFFFFIFLPRCPNIIPNSLERKDPSSCLRHWAAAHLLGRKEGQSLLPGDPGESTEKIRALREAHLLDLEGISAYTGNRQPGAWSGASRVGWSLGARAGTAGRGPLATTCPRQTKRLIGAHPPQNGRNTPLLAPSLTGSEAPGPPRGRGGPGKVM